MLVSRLARQLSVVDGALCWNSAGIMTLTCQEGCGCQGDYFLIPLVRVRRRVCRWSSMSQYLPAHSLRTMIGSMRPSGPNRQCGGLPMEPTNWMQTSITDIQYIEVKYVGRTRSLSRVASLRKSESGEYLLGRRGDHLQRRRGQDLLFFHARRQMP